MCIANNIKYRKINIPNNIDIVKMFCQKLAINWTYTCHILWQASDKGNPEHATATKQRWADCHISDLDPVLDF